MTESCIGGVFEWAYIHHPRPNDQVFYPRVVLQTFRYPSMVLLCFIRHRYTSGSLVSRSFSSSHIPMHTYWEGMEVFTTRPLYRSSTISMGCFDLEHGARLHDPCPANTTSIKASNEDGAEAPRLGIFLPGLHVCHPR